MVIDDEEFCIASMNSILEVAGIDVASKVDFCYNGKEAVEITRDSYLLGISYKFIFTDFSMPIMDGLEATR
jgi:CheY-like chemotaxis protein